MRAAPDPTAVRDFAKSLGWVLVSEAVKDRLYVFNHADKPGRQIVFPLDTAAPDYLEGVTRALVKLGELHKLSLDYVSMAVRNTKDDTLRYSVLSPRLADDSLPLSFATSLLGAAQRMLSSAACTVLKPQPHHPRLSRNEANQLLEHARFGHTEQGSFVVNVSCPIYALETQIPIQGIDGQEVPFVRMTTLTLKRSLEKLIHAVEADTLDALVAEIKTNEAPELSSNFCEAITHLHDEDIRNDIDIAFAWAVVAPPPEADRTRTSIRIQSSYFARIEEVGREIRPKARA